MSVMDSQLANLVTALNRVVEELGSVTTRIADAPGESHGRRGDGDPVRRAQAIFDERRAREKAMPECVDLFGEPGWDMLLYLYLITKRGEETSVSSAAYASAVPATTALRCLRDMEAGGLVRRWPDAMDGRRTLVALTELGVGVMDRYLSSTRCGQNIARGFL